MDALRFSPPLSHEKRWGKTYNRIKCALTHRVNNTRQVWTRWNALGVALYLVASLFVSFYLTFINRSFSRFGFLFQIAEGAIGAVAVWILLPKLLTFNSIVAKILTLPVVVSKNLRKITQLLFVVGTAIFSFMVFIDWTDGISCLHNFHVYMVNTYFNFHPGTAVGFLGFSAFAIATTAIAVNHLEFGFLASFKQALRRFALPAILVLMGGLIFLGQPNQMANHVTSLWVTIWSVHNVYLVSNYSVFVATALLETLLLLKKT